MNDEVKRKILPIYKELQGYLSGCPKTDHGPYQDDYHYSKQLQDAINRLCLIEGDDYTRFQLTVHPWRDGGTSRIDLNEYRMKLNGLIMHLKGKYFPEEADPFSGTPMVTVNQAQVTQVTMLLDVQNLIDKRLYREVLKPEEKTFLEKIKDALPAVKTATELLALIIKTAKDTGIDIHTIAKAFGWA